MFSAFHSEQSLRWAMPRRHDGNKIVGDPGAENEPADAAWCGSAGGPGSRYYLERMPTATFRFYAELNDCLPTERRQRAFPHSFRGEPAVKDAIEALGVPHVEVDLVLVNGRSVGFGYRLRPGDRVAVYPMFESLDIAPVQKVRPAPLRRVAFLADEHLGKLARTLRLLGFDTVYARGLDDAEIVRRASREGRIVLTRDRGLLKRGSVDHGYWVRSDQPTEQAREVVRRFDLGGKARPFTMCLACGGRLQPVDKESVLPRIPPRVRAWRDEFLLCQGCGKLFWRGTHHARLASTVEKILGNSPHGLSRDEFAG